MAEVHQSVAGNDLQFIRAESVVGGLVLNKPTTLLEDPQLPLVENMILDNGLLRSAPAFHPLGRTTVNNEPDPIRTFYIHRERDGTTYNLGISDKRIYRYRHPNWVAQTPAGSTAPVELTGNDSAAPAVATLPSHDWAIITNSTDGPFVFDGRDILRQEDAGGLALADTNGVPFSSFKAGSVAVWNNQVWFANTEEDGEVRPFRIRRSDIGNPTEWRTGNAGYTDLLDSSDAITHIEPIGPYLIVYRQRSVYIGTRTGEADRLIEFVQVAQAKGVYSGQSVVQVGTNHFFLTTEGVFRFHGGSHITAISDNIREQIFERLDEGIADRSFHQIHYHPKRNLLLIVANDVDTNTCRIFTCSIGHGLTDDIEVSEFGWTTLNLVRCILGSGDIAITTQILEYNDLTGTMNAWRGPNGEIYTSYRDMKGVSQLRESVVSDNEGYVWLWDTDASQDISIYERTGEDSIYNEVRNDERERLGRDRADHPDLIFAAWRCRTKQFLFPDADMLIDTAWVYASPSQSRLLLRLVDAGGNPLHTYFSQPVPDRTDVAELFRFSEQVASVAGNGISLEIIGRIPVDALNPARLHWYGFSVRPLSETRIGE